MNCFKKFLIALSLICIVLSSCLKETDPPVIPKGNIISGKISNWTLGTGKKLFAYTVYTNDTLAESPIDSQGGFTLTLKTPAIDAMDSLNRFFDRTLTNNSASVQCADLIFAVTNGDNNFLGYVLNSTVLITGYAEGYCLIHYMYSTKATTIKGTPIDYSTINSRQSGKYDLKLTEGWNTWSFQTTKYYTINNTVFTEYKIGNSDPLLVPWIYYNFKSKVNVDPEIDINIHSPAK